MALLLAMLLACSARAAPALPPPPGLDALPAAVSAAADVPRGHLPWLLHFNATYATAAGLNVADRCAGVLLGPRWALTAAHCLGPDSPPPRTVVSAGGEAFTPVSVHVHPSYYRAKPLDLATRSDFAYNVALLRLREPLVDVPPAPPLVDPAPQEEDVVADHPLDCLVFGWGRRARAAHHGSLLDEDKLKYLSVQAYQFRGCSLGAGPVDPRRVCVLGDAGAPPNTTSSCSGDSGGPLVCRMPPPRPGRWTLLGLSSWNDEGILCDTASRYLHLGAFRDWLEKTMRLHGRDGLHRHTNLSSTE